MGPTNALLDVPRLVSGRLLDDQLEITWEGGDRSGFHLIWLRDNCPRGRAWIEGFWTRVRDVVDLPERPVVERFTAGPDGLRVVWADTPGESCYEASWLFAHRYDRPRLYDRPPRRLWDASVGGIAALPAGDLEDAAFLDALVTTGVVHVTGGRAEEGFAARLLSRFGTLIETSFGRTWQVRLGPEDDPVTREYDYKELALHTDFTFARFAPFIQFLHCVRPDPAGGASVLGDGFQIAEDLRAENPAVFELLSSCPVTYRVQRSGLDLRASRPIITLALDGQIEMIAAADRMMAPLALPPEVVVPFYAALREWESRMMSPRYRVEIHLAAGDLLVWDNGRILHGRSGLSREHGDLRLLVGGYLQPDEVMSRWRLSVNAGNGG
jgi:gamma-butyrobetaine dioxygenase